MRPTCLAPTVFLGVFLGALALSTPAAAQHIELAGRVTASRTVLAQRRVGEPRYVAISDLFYRDRSALLEVLDLSTQTVVQVQAKRSLFERRFGPRDGTTGVPQGEIAMFGGGVVGIALTESATAPERRAWYVELDAATGRLVRTAGLATLRAGEQLEIVGADPAGDAAWFAITEVAGRRRALALRRIDLATLEVRDAQRIELPARVIAGHEHAVTVHASADFSRFAIVEYAEDGVRMAPGHVYILDPAAGSSLAVPAPPTAYGVAFSPDGRYVYLGSAQQGTISRVNLAAGKIDKQVAAPRYLHHLVVSAGGGRLFALASSNRYAVYDLPDLTARADSSHPPGVAPAMAHLSGHGVASLDGAYFVVPEPDDRRRLERDYVIARLVD